MPAHDFDLFVIGAGSGGVRAARVAAAHGARVAIAEEHRVGGTCVIRGCVPKKMMAYAAHLASDLFHSPTLGVDAEGLNLDWSALRSSLAREVSRLEAIYRANLERSEVKFLPGRASIVSPHEVKLASGEVYSASKILIAVGAWPIIPQIPGAELGITSNEIFSLARLPETLVVLGGGYIALEFASIFRALGSNVTLVNRSDTFLRSHDAEVVRRLLTSLSDKGVKIVAGATFEKITRIGADSLDVQLSNGDHISCSTVLHAAGRLPKTGDLGLAKAGIAVDTKGAICVDEVNRTSCETIFAIGDVTNRIQLTPVAIREGQAFADRCFGNGASAINYENVPSAVFTNPPLAAVGLTEEQAAAKFGPVTIYTSDFRPMKNVLLDVPERAFYKLVVHPGTDQVIGLHMLGPESPEILQAAAIAVNGGMKKADFDATMALHPSMAEELVLMK
ncbi:glutathione-disulfide reductase [Sphingobium lactosutens]|uniref:glutathione-disulfide reductase n=1 Tax=Sphingobium lactosutens TaxID=522773 RepID=UPI0015C0D5EF|nr:glutathione-disulfide reductase [Sphingobium lactosutens]NWK97508.1 glutathione-disulfide reductase [Sphingobium lactosutens]